MGSCVSHSPALAAAAGSGRRVATAKVMDLDGSTVQFAAPVTAREALGDDERRRGTSCFVCSSDELRFDAPARALAAEEPLQAEQLYFVLPLYMLRLPLSGQDMATLAVKASSALAVAGASSCRKNGDGVEGNGKQRKAARVAPLVFAVDRAAAPTRANQTMNRITMRSADTARASRYTAVMRRGRELVTEAALGIVQACKG